MKKALLLGLVSGLLAAVPALAYPPVGANVNFTSERGVPFGLVLDGQPLTRGLARQVHVDQVRPGQHWADFTVPTAYGGAVRFRSRVWLQPGLETTFVLVTRPGQQLYLQQVNAVAMYGNGYQNGGGRYNSPTGYDPAPYGQGGNQGSYGTTDPYNNGNTGYDNDDDADYSNVPAPNGGPGYGNNPNNPGGYNSNPNGGYPNNPNGGYPNTPNGGYPNNPNGGYPNTPNGGYPNNPNGTYPNNPGGGNNNTPAPAANRFRSMSALDVDALVKTVQARIAEASKLSAAKEGLAQRSLRSDELTRLLRTISSESCQVELATFAYAHVSDPQNFNRVYEAFATKSGPRAVEATLNNASQR